MSEVKISLKIKVGQIEVQLEGPKQTVLETFKKDILEIMGEIPKLPGLADTLNPTASSATQSPQRLPDSFKSNTDVYPSVRASNCASCIEAALDSSWGRQKPRTLSEIMTALDANALHYTRKVIGFTLTRLTRRQKVRRWKSEQGFVYTMPVQNSTVS